MKTRSATKRRTILLVTLGALACFALGVAAARLAAPAPPSAPAEPRIMIDAGSIELLPDASLHLTLPPGFDAGQD
jgi:hypothetical protein